ncbi:MAG: FHA domain-containing protein [Anaerolineales bacterium]|jgi:hypothetical protein
MTPALALLVLRILLAVALYAFLVMILIYLWRDLRATGTAGEPVPAAHVLVLEGPDPGRCYPLIEVNSLGRAADNLVRLKEDTVSAHHALLTFRGGQWWLEDLGSRNGTKVNEVLVEEPLVVTYGDALKLGVVRLQLKAGEPHPSLDIQSEPDGAAVGG